jgi:hypothetical protein
MLVNFDVVYLIQSVTYNPKRRKEERKDDEDDDKEEDP